jgi:plastocyanin
MPNIWQLLFINLVMKTTAFSDIGVLAMLAVFASIAPPERATSAPVVHKILIEKMAFGPPPVGVHVGDTIEWTNKDIFRHSATSAAKSFDLDMEPDATAFIVVRRGGSFQYTCKYHPGMKGVLTVEK